MPRKILFAAKRLRAQGTVEGFIRLLFRLLAARWWWWWGGVFFVDAHAMVVQIVGAAKGFRAQVAGVDWGCDIIDISVAGDGRHPNKGRSVRFFFHSRGQPDKG